MLFSASFLLLPLFVVVDAVNWGWFSNEENTIVKNEIVIDATRINSDSIRQITYAQKRFVLYNSRRLTGECGKSCYLSPFG
jgi:hypothetical protein